MRNLNRNMLIAPIVLLFTMNTLSGQKGEESNFSLFGRWNLISINEQPISTEIYTQGIPYIEIKNKDQIVSGFTGCNVIQGHIEISGSRLKFGQIISTKRYCEGIPEHVFLETLEQVDAYILEVNILFMLSNETRLLSFIKNE